MLKKEKKKEKRSTYEVYKTPRKTKAGFKLNCFFQAANNSHDLFPVFSWLVSVNMFLIG